jgi:isoleucyl-tRNA synthetase
LDLKASKLLLYSNFIYKTPFGHFIVYSFVMNQKELNQSINAYWKQHTIFQKSLDQRSEKFQSITYDGPPFASGTPHFGHGLTSAMKDAILRYKTMKGYKVNRDR